MCYVIITSRTLLWTLLTIAVTVAMFSALVTPRWLVGAPRVVTVKTTLPSDPYLDDDYFAENVPGFTADGFANHSQTVSTRQVIFTPTVGIFNRCTRIHHFHDNSQYSCAPFVSSFAMPSDEFPNCWKASLVFLSIGLALTTFTVGTSVVGCCVRAIVKKSIFNISGTIQAFAGLFYVIGLFLYPAGWSSRRVIALCGEDASYYVPGECSLGWAFYVALAATFCTFMCAFLSVYADNSTSSDKVQDKISDGKNLICLL